MGVQIYVARAGLFMIAGLLLAITTLVSFGFGISFILLDGLIALYLGPGGTWISNPVALIAILASTVACGLSITLLLFPSIGAFMHTCAEIGSGSRDIGIMEHLQYLQNNMVKLWLVGLCWQAVAFAPMAFILIASVLLKEQIGDILTVLGISVALFVWMMAQFPFWLAFPAYIVKKGGVRASLKNSLVTSIRNPLSSAAILILIYILFIVPSVSFIFYPIYFFLIFTPFAATISLAYYEAAVGMLK